MKAKFSLLVAIFFVCSLAVAQETSSAKSSIPLVLEFKSSPATFTWLNVPEEGVEWEDKTFSLQVGLDVEKDAAISKIEIFNNGETLEGTRGFKKGNSLADRFTKFIDEQVVLKDGDNNIMISVENEDGTKSQEARVIRKKVDVVASLAVETRNDYALVIGTNDYDEWGDLTNPTFDAETIAKELETSYGFEVDLVLNADKATMEKKIYDLYQKSYLDNDQLLIFIAGHGWFNEITKQGYLVPKDGKADDPIGSSYYSYSQLRDLVDGIPSKHVMLMLDACFGGTFDQDIARAGSRGQDSPDMASNAEFIKRKLRFKSRIYITSGGKEYVKDGRPGQHSPFAKQFLQALRTYGGQNGILTKSELKGHMEVLQTMPRMGDFGSYEPGSDFVFIAK